jgi:hypothetical protein
VHGIDHRERLSQISYIDVQFAGFFKADVFCGEIIVGVLSQLFQLGGKSLFFRILLGLGVIGRKDRLELFECST